MAKRAKPVIAYNCPQCNNSTVVQREEGPKELLEWEDTLWKELIFECTHCEWSMLVGRTPVPGVQPAGWQ